VKRVLLVAASVLTAAACASVAPVNDRGDVLRRIVPSTVQLRVEGANGARRAGSGVVVASDPASRRSWIVTTLHLLESTSDSLVYVSPTARASRLKGVVAARSADTDLALIVIEGVALQPVAIKETTRLGEDVWVVGFPWGRRMTVVSGVVSQIASAEGEVALEGAARMVDASVSYGASGGGVFDSATGALIAIVEGYRTARVSHPTAPERVVEVPVPGETTVIAAATIRRFLSSSGIATR